MIQQISQEQIFCISNHNIALWKESRKFHYLLKYCFPGIAPERLESSVYIFNISNIFNIRRIHKTNRNLRITSTLKHNLLRHNHGHGHDHKKLSWFINDSFVSLHEKPEMLSVDFWYTVIVKKSTRSFCNFIFSSSLVWNKNC